MKKSFAFYFKTILACIGFLVLLVSGILAFIQKTTISLDMSGQLQNSVVMFRGYNTPFWYAIVVATIVVFTLGYFYHKTINIVLVFIIAPFSALAIFMYVILTTFTVSIDFPTIIVELKDGFFMAISGALLVVAATMISVLRKKEKKQEYFTRDLLDN